MKKVLFTTALIAITVAASSCKKDPVDRRGDGPKISNLVVQSDDTDFQVPGELTYSVDISDPSATLSTLEVSVEMGETVLASDEISLFEYGKQHTISDGVLAVPFAPGMVENTPLTVKFTAVNVPGGETYESVTLNLKRPVIDELYVFLDGAQEGIAMTRDGNKFSYATGDIMPSSFTAKFATSADIADAEFAWIGSGEEGSVTGVVGDGAGAGIAANFFTTIVEAVTFDVVSFELGVEGEVLEFSINNTDLIVKDGLLFANIAFTKDAVVPFSGFDDMENAYNRDFFTYENGTLTYIRESDSWDIYYSMQRNYMYVVKTTAVAPETYWIVGKGFNSASVWTSDMNTDYFTEMGEAAYMVRTADNTYQASVYLKVSPALEFYTSLEWTKDFHFAASGGLTGDTEGLVINNLGTDSESENLATTTGFKPGYYELTLNVANKDAATLNVELIKEEPPIELAVSVNGTPLTAGSESLEGTFTFTKGQSVTVTGIDDLAAAYNRDMFAYVNATTLTFLRETGEYKFAFYPAYNYTYAWQDPADGEYYPAAYRGCGWHIGNAPGFESVTGNWDLSMPVGCYIPMIAENTYQVTLWITTEFELQVYSNSAWSIENGMIFSETAGTAGSNFQIATNSSGETALKTVPGFTEGLYKFVFDTTDTQAVIVTVTAAE